MSAKTDHITLAIQFPEKKYSTIPECPNCRPGLQKMQGGGKKNQKKTGPGLDC